MVETVDIDCDQVCKVCILDLQSQCQKAEKISLGAFWRVETEEFSQAIDQAKASLSAIPSALALRSYCAALSEGYLEDPRMQVRRLQDISDSWQIVNSHFEKLQNILICKVDALSELFSAEQTVIRKRSQLKAALSESCSNSAVELTAVKD